MKKGIVKKILSKAQKAALAKGRAALISWKKAHNFAGKPKTAKERLDKKLKVLSKAGRNLVRSSASYRKKKPFYFSGSEKNLESIIITKGENTMARKRKSTRKTSKRKTTRYHGDVTPVMGRKRRGHRKHGRRMHGLSVKKLGILETAKDVVGVAGGAVAVSFLSNFIPLKNTKIKAFIPVVLGAILGSTKYAKNPFVKAASMGMIAVGTISLVKQFAPQLPLLSGETGVVALNPAEAAAMLGYAGESEFMGAPLQGEVTAGNDIEDSFK